jgi:hypothetical protein
MDIQGPAAGAPAARAAYYGSLSGNPSVKRKLLILFVVAVITVAMGYGMFLSVDHLDRGTRDALKGAPQVTLYSLYPYPYDIKDGEVVRFADDVPKFHGFRILGETSLPQGDTRETAVDAMNDAVNRAARAWTHSVGACFKPRHGLRATDASGTYDLVLCFQCGHLHLYLPDGTKKYYVIDGTGTELNRILESAKVPLPKE